MAGRVLLSLALLGAPLLLSALEISFVGMQGDKAALMVDKRMHLLRPGQTVGEGLRLLAADRSSATLRVGGQTFRYARGGGRPTPLPGELVLPRQANGMYHARGTINGSPVDFVVDTGASHVVLSRESARQLRLRYRNNRPVKVVTASGVVSAYQVTLESVSVGGIFRTRVPALITPGKQPSVALLGMTFLETLEIVHTGEEMQLRE